MKGAPAHTRSNMNIRWDHIAFVLLVALPASSCIAADGPEPSLQDSIYRAAMESIQTGDKEQAIAQLEVLVLEAPNHAGAWLDLAILFCEAGAEDRALALFSYVETRFHPNPGVQEIIANLRSKGCAPARAWPRLRSQLSLGFDSNARLGSAHNEISLGPPDNPIDVILARNQRAQSSGFGGLSIQIAAQPWASTEIFAHFDRRDFTNTPDVNSSVWALGFVQEAPSGFGKQILFSGAIGQMSLGGEPFYRSATLMAQLPLASPDGWIPGLTVDGTITAYRFELNPLFDSRVWSIQGHLQSTFGPGQQTFSLGVLNDMAEAGRPGGDRRGWLMQWEMGWPTPSNNRWEFLGRQQRLIGTSAYSPGLIDQRRDSTTRVAIVGYTMPVSQNHEVRLQTRYQHNRDSISLFRFESLAAEISWSCSWH